MNRGNHKAFAAKAAAMTAALFLAMAALAATPSVSVPSTPDTDGKVQIRGTDLAAFTNVTVRFTHEGMLPIDVVAQVAADGKFAIKFTPPLVGGYAVTVYDANGQQIGKGNFGYIR